METWNVRHLTPPQSVGDIGRLKIGRFLLVFQSVIGYTAAQFHALFTKPRKIKMKNDFATKADLKKTADGLHHEISAVRTDVSRTEKTLRHEIAAVRTELNQKIDSVENNLKADIEKVAVQVIHVSTDLESLKLEVGDFKEEFLDYTRRTDNRFDGVMNAIDGLAGLIKNGQTEKAAVSYALQRHENKLDEHEIRIGSLEPKG
jgi:uncharacterized coiled-coil DUF342 family protein